MENKFIIITKEYYLICQQIKQYMGKYIDKNI